MDSAVLKYPFPYKAWLTMANDPDNTLIADWKELHGFIWEELGLPFGDSLFVKSFNENLPIQVNLMDNPEIGTAHLHDTIHTWGDYMHARKRGFDREDAEEAAQILKAAGIAPKVWIDHASFVGNMVHGTNKGAMNKLLDSSGHEYQNFVYSLDIARELGIRYVWNGEVSPVCGQDRDLAFGDHKMQSGGSRLKASAKSVLQQLPGVSAAYVAPDNRQYYPHTFQDGSKMYLFRRYGTWQDADIDGLHTLIEPDRIDQLLKNGGSAVVYSHLGKRHPSGADRKRHIPKTTRADLQYVKTKFESKELMVSSVSGMLDYMVVRDQLKTNRDSNTIEFISDGIRFETLVAEDLKGMCFSFKKSGLNPSDLNVLVDGAKVACEIQSNSNSTFSISF